MLEVLIHIITSGPIVVKKLLQISVQVYHHCFLATKKYYAFWNTFGGMYVIGHLHLSIQVQYGFMIEQHGIVNGIRVVFQFEFFHKGIKSCAGQSHATIFSQIEPPDVHGQFCADALLIRQQLDQFFGEFLFVTHIKDRSGRRTLTAPR